MSLALFAAADPAWHNERTCRIGFALIPLRGFVFLITDIIWAVFPRSTPQYAVMSARKPGRRIKLIDSRKGPGPSIAVGLSVRPLETERA